MKSRIILDTGATSSLVPFSWVQFLGNKVVKTASNTTSARVAGGGIIPLEAYRVSFEIISKKHVLNFQNALVTRFGPQDIALMGVQDLVNNNMCIESKNKKVVKFTLNDVPVINFDTLEMLNLLHNAGSIKHDDDDNL